MVEERFYCFNIGFAIFSYFMLFLLLLLNTSLECLASIGSKGPLKKYLSSVFNCTGSNLAMFPFQPPNCHLMLPWRNTSLPEFSFWWNSAVWETIWPLMRPTLWVALNSLYRNKNKDHQGNGWFKSNDFSLPRRTVLPPTPLGIF